MSSALRASFVAELGARCDRVDLTYGRFARFHDEPVAFAREVLGYDPWARQRDILQAMSRSNRVSVVSGNGVGKTDVAAILAWWFVCTREPGCRVFLTSSKGDQTERAVWKAVRRLWLKSKMAIGGALPKLGKTGWDGPDGQEILILTADQAEKMQGLRAPDMLVIADEASGIEDRLFDAIEGNLSGDGKLLLIGNPAEPVGYFWESQKPDSSFTRLHISALESPNVVAGRIVIKGLTTLSWCEMRERDWGGKESARYQMRVLGKFLVNEAGKPITWKDVTDAQARLATTTPTGRLCVGLDPAGPGKYGDETAIVWRRGNAMLGCITSATWTEDQIIEQVLGVMRSFRTDETPLLVVDSGGPPGGSLYGRLSAIGRGARPGHDFEAIGVRSDAKAQREPQYYAYVRDELFENLSRWLKAGGAITEDGKLAVELNAPKWLVMTDGRQHLQKKDEIRKIIGRSPDRADALALSLWAPGSWTPAEPTSEPGAPAPPRDQFEAASAFDMQSGNDPWWPDAG